MLTINALNSFNRVPNVAFTYCSTLLQVCRTNLNLGESFCDEIQQHKEEQSKVQQHVATLRIYNSVLRAVPLVLFTLIAGPWSDQHGRKPLIVVSTLGFCLCNLVFLVNTYFFNELTAEYLLFEVLQDLTGGGVVFFMACTAYMVDITSPQERTKRVAFMAGLNPIGFNLGKGLSGLIKDNLGFMSAFGFALIVSVLTAAYVILFVEESSVKKAHDWWSPKKGQMLCQLFSLENLQGGVRLVSSVLYTSSRFQVLLYIFRALKKPRENNMRALILLMVFAFSMVEFTNVGEGNQYLYFRRQLDFTIMQYTVFSIIVGIIAVTSQYVMIPILSERLNLRDSTIMIICTMGNISQAVILSLATAMWMAYLGAFVSFLESTAWSMSRCMISKCVRPDEVGKVLSVKGVCQALIPLVASPLFGSIYGATVKHLPQTYLIVIAGCYVLNLAVLVYIDRGLKRAAAERNDDDAKQVGEFMADRKERETTV